MKTQCHFPTYYKNFFGLVCLTLIIFMMFCFPSIGQSADASDKSAVMQEYVIIKSIDSSEKKLYNCSFLYRWADYDEAPPKGYTWSSDTEKTSEVLFLKRVSDGTRIQIGLNEIEKIEMTWEKSEYVPRWLVRKSLTIVKTNGERIVIRVFIFPFLAYEYYVDKSALTKKKWAQKGTAYLYIIGNENDKQNSPLIKFPLFYDNSVLYEQNKFSVPKEIIFVRDQAIDANADGSIDK